MNHSRLELKRTGLVTDGGAPRCPTCRARLSFNTDRQGRATESCECGYGAYVATRRTDAAHLETPSAGLPPSSAKP